MLRKDCHRHVIEKCDVGRRQAERNGLVVRHRNLLDVFKVRRVLRAVVGIHDGFDRELYVRCGEGLPIVPRDAGFQVEGVGVRLFVKIPVLSKTRHDVVFSVVGGQTVKYAYDMAGVRSSKQVGDTTYTYTTLSGKVMRQAWGDNNALEFVYDDSSQPFAVIYKHGSAAELYYYLVNAQGDVAAILDSSGTMVASYNYDAWGSCTVYNSSDAAIGDLNPLRYRGYYYDAETGFYYLQSRYYDPAICRFINADGLFTDGFVGSNLFAYCVNDPVNTVDPTGNFAITATVALITFGIALVATAFAVGISSSPGFQEAVEGLCESVGDIAGQIKEKLTNSFSKIKKPPNYRSNKEVHHIVAQRAPGAAHAQKILAELEIGINDPVNTVSINTCLHRRLHTKLYYELVNIVIVGAYNSAGGDREQQIENVTSALKSIRSFIFVLDRTTPKF